MENEKYTLNLLKEKLSETNKEIENTLDWSKLSSLVLRRKNLQEAINYLSIDNESIALFTSIKKAFYIGINQKRETNILQDRLYAKSGASFLANGYRRVIWEAYKAGRLSTMLIIKEDNKEQ